MVSMAESALHPPLIEERVSSFEEKESNGEEYS